MASTGGYFLCVFLTFIFLCDGAKINTPRVLLPWFENRNVNFTFEIIEGGCYTWSLSRDDIIDLEPIYDDTWGHCSRSARVSVSKSCVPPGSVIILAEELNSNEIIRGDVDIDKISFLKIISTTWKLYLEEAPEAFEVIAYDEQGNKFSTLEGIDFDWRIENTGSTLNDDPIVDLVPWTKTDYEAPKGISELEARGLHAHSVLLYGKAMGDSKVTVCLQSICTDFTLQVIASVVLNPATAYIAPGDALQYKVIRAKAGRLTVQNVADTMYNIKVDKSPIAILEDALSIVRGKELGTTAVHLMSGSTEVATGILNVVQPYSIRVNIRPPGLLIEGEEFTIYCLLLDGDGHALTAGPDVLIRLSVEGDANVELLRSTENGTLTNAVAQNSGKFTVVARLYSIAGRTITEKVQGQTSGFAISPLQIVPPEMYVAWTDSKQEIQLKHSGGGDQPVLWSEGDNYHSALKLSPSGLLTVRGVGQLDVNVYLENYHHINAVGRILSAIPELVQVSSSGHARVSRPHHLHIALSATHPATGELFNFHRCDCNSFAVSLLDGPEPFNVTAVPWIEPLDGACCVMECWWESRGVSTVRVSRGRAGEVARITVTAAPALVWPAAAALLTGATVPVLAEGEALKPHSLEPRVSSIEVRGGPAPYRYPDMQLFTMKCNRKGDTQLQLSSEMEGEVESAELGVSCASYVSKIRLEPSETPGNCSMAARIWLRPGQDVSLKVTLLDSASRELLDEQGPQMSWEVQPNHIGIEFKSADRLFVETNPEYDPVPVPMSYYQVLSAGENAIGWSGMLKASIPDATATIQAKVVAPLSCQPTKVNIAWENESPLNISVVMGGSGRYAVETPKGVSARIENNALSAILPAPGCYELVVSDMCVHGERITVEVNIEEVMSVEVTSARAVSVGGCVAVSALARSSAGRPLAARRGDWRASPNVAVRGEALCGLSEGAATVRAGIAGMWSPELEVTVFPSLRVVPERSRLPPGAKLHLRHTGGPPHHLATFTYKLVKGNSYVEVSPSGVVHGVSLGTSRIKLIALDNTDVELATAEAVVEVVSISEVRVRAATQTLLVGRPGRVWVEAGGLSTRALAALVPAPRATWSLREAALATLHSTHAAHATDIMERSTAEGLSIRVVPLKPGLITIDVKIRNLGQMSESRSWDSTIEIFGIADIVPSVEGLKTGFVSDRLSVAVGATVKLNSVPRSTWVAYEDGAFDMRPNGELIALKPGRGVALARHRDERNNIDRETVVHVEVAIPQYCTAEPSNDEDSSIRVVLRDHIGRELVAPQANVSVLPPYSAHIRRSNSAYGSELLVSGVEGAGAFIGFQSSVFGHTVTDEVWVEMSEADGNSIVGVGSFAICLEGVGWRPSSAGVQVLAGAGVSLALLTRDTSGRHVLKLDRPPIQFTIHQVPVQKMEFLPGDWPSSFVPIAIGSELTSNPLLCSEDQKYALLGLEVELPYICRTKPPHTAMSTLDIPAGQLGCSIIQSSEITQPQEIDLCAEWGVFKTCTKVQLLPRIQILDTKISLLNPPATFTILGHPRTLKQIRITTSPGLRVEQTVKDSEMIVLVQSDSASCGHGWVNVASRLTSQEIKVEVEKECDIACGTLLGALFSLLKPYLTTIVTLTLIAGGYVFVQSKLQKKVQMRLPTEPAHTVLPDTPQNRTRSWSRSPYASNGQAAPIYGDTSIPPDSSFSPTSRMHRMF
ncbi:nuclear pore membrane glycoprotein 210 [Leptidea sinapis]|uniref:nuclear pore membrane glycoprotein 210 n=1 Tax=Leptidea sinapis TaxID=189913 RepID=UPI00213ED3A3|nr:nuclear pore membrane glycoprotein 210 [Leptidea sinapis]